jgi:hypothetical protein
MSWTLTDLRAKFRTLTGRPSTGQISNSDITTYLNDYYRYSHLDGPTEYGPDQQQRYYYVLERLLSV